MNCNKALEVYNPYLKLPSYGENRVNLIHSDSDLSLVIFYDNTDDENDLEEKKIKINFKGVCSYSCSSFPGVKMNNIEYGEYTKISSLVEFEFSDLKTNWENHFRNMFKYRHFKIFFLNSNQSLEVIARELDVFDDL